MAKSQRITKEQIQKMSPEDIRELGDYGIARDSLKGHGIHAYDDFRKRCASIDYNVCSVIWDVAVEDVRQERVRQILAAREKEAKEIASQA